MDKLSSLIILPDLSAFPDLRFSGTGATDWLKGVNRLFTKYKLKESEMIAELPYWTDSPSMKDRVKAVLDDVTQWNEASKRILKTFKLQDPKQIRTAKDRLRTLTKQAQRSVPDHVYKYCLEHAARVRDILEEAKQKGKTVTKDEYTESLLEGLSASCLEGILNNSSMKLEDLQDSLDMKDVGDSKEVSVSTLIKKKRSGPTRLNSPSNNDQGALSRDRNHPTVLIRFLTVDEVDTEVEEVTVEVIKVKVDALATLIKFPQVLKSQAIEQQIPIWKKISEWIHGSPAFPARLKEKMRYFDRRDDIFRGVNSQSTSPDPDTNSPAEPQKHITILKPNRQEPDTDQNRVTEINMTHFVDHNGEPFYREVPALEIDDSDQPTVLTSVMMAKRSRDDEDEFEGTKRNKTEYETDDDELMYEGPTFHNMEVGAQTDNTPQIDASTPQADDGTQTDNTLTHGGLIAKHIVKFWEKKIRENSKRKFEITWSELIEVCPDFGKAFKNFMAAKTLEALSRKNKETIKMTEAEVRGSEVPEARRPARILTMDIGYKPKSQKKAKVLSIQQCSPTEYITPLFRLAVKVGHGGGENLISGVIDTGAESSVIVASKGLHSKALSRLPSG
ncbi:hypothetical protein DL768_005001 [Monosporascus sp. mg162]|nr:hypothetical protein DL768_005001 [Monosporascus sp. mg162]